MTYINIDSLAESIAETTRETLRNYEIITTIEEIRKETNNQVLEILRG